MVENATCLDVVVVGAGAAGLGAGRRLAECSQWQPRSKGPPGAISSV